MSRCRPTGGSFSSRSITLRASSDWGCYIGQSAYPSYGQPMPFYLRKSLNVGPFRFNLSGSGVGMSAGVKGFRVGTGPRGHYIHAGTGGFYYRSSLNGQRPPRYHGSRLPATRLSGVGPHQPVETGNILQMVDADAASILNSINDKISKIGTWPIALACVGAALVVLLSLGPTSYPYMFLLVSDSESYR